MSNKACFCCGTQEGISKFPLDGRYWCEQCLIDYALKCRCCGGIGVFDRDIHWYEGETYLCKKCAGEVYTCKGCGTPKRSKVTTKYGDYCPTCIQENFFKCTTCDEYHPKDKRLVEIELHKYPKHIKTQDTCEDCFIRLTTGVEPLAVHECAHCKTITSHTVTFDGQVIKACPNCAKHLYKCCDCGKIRSRRTSDGSSYNTYMGGSVCHACVISRWSFCAHCSLAFPRDQLNEHRLCKGCATKFFSCEHCHRLHSVEERFEVDEQIWCKRCAMASYKTCAHCKERKYGVLMTDTHQRSDEAGEYICYECRVTQGYALIRNYSWKAVPTFLGDDDPNALFMGFENEFSFSGKLTPHGRQLARAYNERFIHLKHDGSIDNGFEAVSQPMTFEYFKSQDWGPFFDIKCRKSESCGLHVHLNRKAFNPKHLLKFLKFFYHNRHFTTFIAERNLMDSWANRYTKALDGNLEEKVEGKNIQDKYTEVNLQPTTTIEVRIFQGATKEEQLHKAIEFCHSVFHFTKQASLDGVEDVNHYISWLNPDVYPYLTRFLVDWKRDTPKVEPKPKPKTPAFEEMVELVIPSLVSGTNASSDTW